MKNVQEAYGGKLHLEIWILLMLEHELRCAEKDREREHRRGAWILEVSGDTCHPYTPKHTYLLYTYIYVLATMGVNNIATRNVCIET